MNRVAVRELRVTDIRCGFCGAAPGVPCRRKVAGTGPHAARDEELAELVEAGWQWQEVDPHDAGKRKDG